MKMKMYLFNKGEIVSSYKSSKMVFGVVVALGASLGGCSKATPTQSTAILGQPSTSSTRVQGNFSVAVYAVDSSNHAIQPALYSDTNRSSGFQLVAGKSYIFKITSSIANASFKLTYTNIDIPAAPSSAPITLKLGDNLVQAPAAADYSFVITPVASSSIQAISKTYQANVSCANPTFSAADLVPSSIGVAAVGGNNLFNYSSSSVVNPVNHGQAPFLCAWDFNGVGIIDTPFMDCNTPVNNVFIDYVGYRHVGLVVKDACNSPVTVTKLANLPYSVPSMPGNVFVHAVTSGTPVVGGTVSNSNDPRIYGVKFLATNPGNSPVPVQPSFNPNRQNHAISNFTIQASSTFGMPSSLPFGVTLTVTNITGDYTNNGGGNGTLDVSNAHLALSYVTDQAGDSSPSVQIGSNCTLSGQGIKTHFVAGPPCSGNTPNGSQNTLTVEVWGSYTCTGVAVPGGNPVNITGSFDGSKSISDSCYSGGGGGGVTPIGL